MNIRTIMSWSLLVLASLAACDDDDEDQAADSLVPKRSSRVERIVGENKVWGRYELGFEYRSDGLLERVWRTDADDRTDTTGVFTVLYDVDMTDFRIYDRVLRIDPDSVERLKVEFPASWKDTLQHRKTAQSLYTVKRTAHTWEEHVFRPRRNVGHGDEYDPSYMNVSASIQRLERVPGTARAAVIRCNEMTYGSGGENDRETTTVIKYEFRYSGSELVSVQTYVPDSEEDSSWRLVSEMGCGNHAGTLVSVESGEYRMRRSGRTVVIAEPGLTTTYTLNDEGLAVKMENSDGEKATVIYGKGSGNFSELYALPLDEALGKVWIR